jgi:hypothetical protein
MPFRLVWYSDNVMTEQSLSVAGCCPRLPLVIAKIDQATALDVQRYRGDDLK